MVTSIDCSKKETLELNSSVDDTVAAGKERVTSSKRMQCSGVSMNFDHTLNTPIYQNVQNRR